MRSIHYRGTPERPGLVLALDRQEGASCAGVAYRVAGGDAGPVLDYLRARELVSDAYLETELPVTLADGRSVTALTYVIDHAHVQYCAGLSAEDQARIIATAAGKTGRNSDYLFNTVAHLDELGLSDPDLAALGDRVRALLAESRRAPGR